LFHAIIYREIIYDFISQYHPPPPTTEIFGAFKKSTAISKGYNVGLRYIKYTMYQAGYLRSIYSTPEL
jgi:hypothetical protein